MRAKHHTVKPTENHITCETKNCNNYYNVLYIKSNGKCKPCNSNNKRKKHE